MQTLQIQEIESSSECDKKPHLIAEDSDDHNDDDDVDEDDLIDEDDSFLDFNE